LKPLIYGHISALELTWSNRNGWHPHLHLLLFFRSSDAAREALFDRIRDKWLSCLRAVGRTGSTERAFDRRTATGRDAVKVGAYLTAADIQWDAAAEMTGAAWKTAAADGLTHTGILAWAAETGEVKAVDLVDELVAATRGRKWLTWSPGLAKALGVEGEDGDEEAIAAAALAEGKAEPVAFIAAPMWRRLSRRLAEIMDRCDTEGVHWLICKGWALPWAPPDKRREEDG
jgi:hypothetical protein